MAEHGPFSDGVQVAVQQRLLGCCTAPLALEHLATSTVEQVGEYPRGKTSAEPAISWLLTQ